MMATCAALAEHSGTIRGAMDAVECHSRTYAQAGYEALGGAGSPFQSWLNILLVIYVAALGYRLMMGHDSRSFNLTTIGLTLGAVVALVGNWTLFQTLVFDLVTKAPLEVAAIVTHPATNNSAFAGDPRASIQVVYDQLSLAAADFARASGPNTPIYAGGKSGAAQALWQSSQSLFYATAGVFSLSVITAAVLTAVGPILITLSLFEVTRGLFAGWVRGLLAALLVSLLCWLSAALMLSILEPGLITLARQRMAGDLQVDTALSVSALVMLFSVVQVGVASMGVMMAMGFKWPESTASRARPSQVRTDISMTEGVGHRSGESLSRAEQLSTTLRQSPASQAYRTDLTGPRPAASLSGLANNDTDQRLTGMTNRRAGRLPDQDRVRP